MPWYDTPIAVAALAVTLTLITNLIYTWVDQRRRRRQRANMVVLALSAEVMAMKGILQPTIATIEELAMKGAASFNSVMLRRLPTYIFDGNPEVVFDIGHKELCHFFVRIYAAAKRANEEVDFVLRPQEKRDVRSYLMAAVEVEMLAQIIDKIVSNVVRNNVRVRDAYLSEEDAKRINHLFDVLSRIAGRQEGGSTGCH